MRVSGTGVVVAAKRAGEAGGTHIVVNDEFGAVLEALVDELKGDAGALVPTQNLERHADAVRAKGRQQALRQALVQADEFGAVVRLVTGLVLVRLVMRQLVVANKHGRVHPLLQVHHGLPALRDAALARTPAHHAQLHQDGVHERGDGRPPALAQQRLEHRKVVHHLESHGHGDVALVHPPGVQHAPTPALVLGGGVPHVGCAREQHRRRRIHGCGGVGQS